MMKPLEPINRRTVFQRILGAFKAPVDIFPTYFLRLRIANKIMLGYVFLVMVVFAISAFAMVNLKRLNASNNIILRTDATIDTADKMIDAVLAQELYAQRYRVLKTPEILERYWESDREFDRLVTEIKLNRHLAPALSSQLKALHRRYSDALRQVLLSPGIPQPQSANTQKQEQVIRNRQDDLIRKIKALQTASAGLQKSKTEEIAAIGKLALRTSALLCLVGVLISVLAALLITRNIAGAVQQLKKATRRIAAGQFDFRPAIVNQDELGELAASFGKMANRLKQLEETHLDCNPLTRLPGGTSIEKNLQRRIDDAHPIAFMLIDIDYFKPYNDFYGYARGNDLLKATADIIVNVVKTWGTAEDFVGHIGGDDFMLITHPDCYEAIGHELIRQFDRICPGFYDETSRKQGFIINKNRQGQDIRMPLATISIAVVTNTHRPIASHIHFGEIAAEMKRYAKSKPGSICVVDQRRGDNGSDVQPEPNQQ